tara:strand:+ start:10521 stop:12002 length:1482 start_codon:yes stop_codon:yes gene_type:complete
MKNKILFWIDSTFTQFGTAKFLEKKCDAEFYAIIDTNKGKKFYENQKIVNFKKKWFLKDHIVKLPEKVDLNYLAEFEKKYKISIWKLAYSDTIFFKYNQYYKFNKNEILRIFEQECRLFENILDEINPDYLIIKITDASHMRLLQLLCQAKGIKVLSLGFTRFGYRSYIGSDNDVIDEIDNKTKENNSKSFEQLEDYLKGYSDQDRTWGNKYQSSKIKWIKAGMDFLLLTLNKNYRKDYTHYGRTVITAIINEISFSIKRIIRKRFLNKNAKIIITDKKFIYFPLQLEPERTLLIPAPYFSNQLEVIKNIAKAIPIEYKLVVKEHPMQKVRAWRNIEYYKEILSLPNVEFVHPSISNEKVIKKCSLVITATGTAGLEAALYQKPSIVLADVNYQTLPSVYRIKNIEELPEKIKLMLQKKVSLDDFSKLTNIVLENSFKIDETSNSIKVLNSFYHGGFLLDVKMNESKVNSFLNENDSFYELLATEFLKKMNKK